jgi:hypothetical protein
MSSTTADLQVRSYVAALERYLDDLPDEDRRELLEDVEQHLEEVAAENEGTLVERLGTPEEYGAELRASAGIPARGRARWGVDLPVLTRRYRALRESAVVRGIGDCLPQLRPAWWVLRGYLAIMAIDAWLFTPNGVTSSLVVPIPYFNENQGYGLLAVLVAIWASVVLGMRSTRERRVRYMNLAATLAVVFLTLGTSPFQPAYPYVDVEYAQTVMPEWLHHDDGSAISNVCAYDSKLKPLKHVLLYDQLGRPIVNTGPVEFGGEATPGSELEPGLANAYPRTQMVIDPRNGELRTFVCPKSVEDPDARAGDLAPPVPPKLRRFVDD